MTWGLLAATAGLAVAVYCLLCDNADLRRRVARLERAGTRPRWVDPLLTTERMTTNDN